ncbi:Multiprotein bridging factor 1b [Abeliophyllum distichum]|uniref:Multiprotein bridging factor 1b n=1 Tax=Abeliophyllum distichum TaxID=126358 RepID=A0ABD1UQL4_9LAMI
MSSCSTFIIRENSEGRKQEEMAGMSQDWEPVVMRKRAPTAAACKDEKAVNAARRSGAEIKTVRKLSKPSPARERIYEASFSTSLFGEAIRTSAPYPYKPEHEMEQRTAATATAAEGKNH